MFKNIIAPVQAWLLSHGQCVGCGSNLSSGQVRKSKIDNQTQITCKCGRVFLKDNKTGVYRRALLSEI